MIGVPRVVGEVVIDTTVLTQASIVPHPELETYTFAFVVPLSATKVTTLSGNIGCEGSRPILQVGGVHDAMMVAPPPPAAANARPLLAVTDPDSEELQVNGTLVI